MRLSNAHAVLATALMLVRFAAVTDTPTSRTYTFTTDYIDPPASLGSGTPFRIVALGVNALGDAVITATNFNITLTNP